MKVKGIPYKDLDTGATYMLVMQSVGLTDRTLVVLDNKKSTVVTAPFLRKYEISVTLTVTGLSHDFEPFIIKEALFDDYLMFRYSL